MARKTGFPEIIMPGKNRLLLPSECGMDVASVRGACIAGPKAQCGDSDRKELWQAEVELVGGDVSTPRGGYGSFRQAGAVARVRADYLGSGCGEVASLGCNNLLVGMTSGTIGIRTSKGIKHFQKPSPESSRWVSATSWSERHHYCKQSPLLSVFHCPPLIQKPCSLSVPHII